MMNTLSMTMRITLWREDKPMPPALKNTVILATHTHTHKSVTPERVGEVAWKILYASC